MTPKPHMAPTQLSIPEAINLRHSTEKGHQPSAYRGGGRREDLDIIPRGGIIAVDIPTQLGAAGRITWNLT